MTAAVTAGSAERPGRKTKGGLGFVAMQSSISRDSSGAPLRVVSIRVDPTSYGDATERVFRWAEKRESRYVCVATVHMVMEAYDSPEYADVVNGADLVTPDGMPLVWMLRRLGKKDQGRVYGPDLTLKICERAAKEGVPVGFYGGTEDALAALVDNLASRFPGLEIAYAYSPPFRPLAPEEDARIVEAINRSGARILFVGLGCPKQERWMAAHKGSVRAPMLGVGAAFDFHAGRVRQAPRWMQNAGLEWLFRFLMEPRRLWRRYVKHNPRFMALALVQLIRKRSESVRPTA